MTNNSNENHEKNCYSTEELQEFKEIILQKLEKAEENLARLTEAVANGESDISDTAPTFKLMDEGSNVLSKEENAKLAARQLKFIKDLKAALVRIENKTYGICKVTGKLIPKERLRVVPHTTMSVEAKLTQKKR
ncbi:MAG: TraR/DksA family transcriptional regulator [Bacteroidales bacterium]|nr:TraR/DksA family transcriptional regulator [Bacteroidales bacterium]